MEVNYYSKYLKYKTKYLQLKAQLGGDDNLKDIITDITEKKCNKKKEKDCKEETGCYYKSDKCIKNTCDNNKIGSRRLYEDESCNRKYCERGSQLTDYMGSPKGKRTCTTTIKFK
jgi:hypothetical protein